ncbi:MAG TPA: aldo/keto reductase [Gemmatales bacterium]|nr:aldo/keto reductase [Gemmatales bacterium]
MAAAVQSTLGVLGPLPLRLGLGLLRLSTAGRPATDQAIALIHAALDQGVRLLDTADSYGLDHTDLHYGEKLARQAVANWSGPRAEVRIITKVGLARPKGRWMPAGRPEQIRKAVAGSREALGVERLFLVQLHARDPAVPFEETLAALAELQRAGQIEHLGLCNVTAAELRQAQRHFPVAVVQTELSLLSRGSAESGLVALTGSEGIPFLAHRPLGGYAKVGRLEKNRVLAPLAARRQVTPHQVALAAVLDAAPHVVPLVGATRLESLASSLAALRLVLDTSDRTALGIKYSLAPSPAALAALSTPSPAPTGATLPTDAGPGSHPEVVLIMGIQGAGKSRLVESYLAAGYARLNRDQLGGKLDDLVPRLQALLSAGQRRVVLDNTYPTRTSRASVIAAAWSHGVPVRCRFLQTPLPEAQVNVVLRQIERYGKLLSPEEMKTLSKSDPNLPPPVALSRWAASLEPPAADEGFAAIDLIPFVRQVDPAHDQKGLLLDVDGTLRRTRSGEIYPRHPDDVEVLAGRRAVLERWVAAGYRLFFVSNQSGVASGKVDRAAVEAAFLRTAELLGVPVAEIAYCPHSAFPVGCYCRKPLPGLGVHLMQRHRLARAHLVMVGDMESDAGFGANLGARYFQAEEFFGLHGPRPEDLDKAGDQS